MSTVPQIIAGLEGSADHSRLSANWPLRVLIAGSVHPASLAFFFKFSASVVV